MRPALAHRRDERLDEIVVVLPSHALVPPADIERIAQPLLVVRADIEQHGQRLLRVNAGAGGIERQLADRDAHAARALIAQPQDALAVADDDHPHLVEMRIGQDLADAVPCWGSSGRRRAACARFR